MSVHYGIGGHFQDLRNAAAAKEKFVEEVAGDAVNGNGAAYGVLTEEDEANGCVMGPDGYIYRPPPQSQQLRIDMQVCVTKCTTWREVLNVVADKGDLFDFRNTSTAVHRVARYGQEESHNVMAHPVWPRLLLLLRAKWNDLSARALSDAAWGLAKLQCRDEEVFRRLAIKARQLAKELDPQGLALTAWSFATVGKRDEELFKALTAEAQKKMHDFGPQNISNLVWATATLGFQNEELHAQVMEAALRNIDGFSGQNLAMVNWALTKLAFPVSEAWRAAFRRKMMTVKEFAPSELSMMAWALATRNEYDPDQMAYIARRSMELMRTFTGQHIATIVWAIATVSYKDDPSIDELLGMALGAICGRANEFQPLNIALISWGLAKLSYRAEVAFESLCASATRQIDQFVPQNLVQVLWACATAGYRSDEFLFAAAPVAKRRLRDFSSQHLSNFIWALARLGFKDDPDLLRHFSEEAIRKAGEGSPQHLSNVAWAISQLGPEHFPGCLSMIVGETSRRLQEFDPPSLMMLSDSLFDAKFGQNGEEPLMAVMRNRVLQMGSTLLDVFSNSLPRRRGVCSPGEIGDYQRRVRSVGLVTYGYEHTHSLLQQLALADAGGWNPADAMALPGWTTNARRSTTARRYQLSVGSQHLQDGGTIFTSAFAASSEDAQSDFAVCWLGQGKADAPTSGRASRIGDAECRCFLDTHEALKRSMQENATNEVHGFVDLHTSGVPCLSCVGVAAQFKRCYPRVSIRFTFAPREHGYDGPEFSSAPSGPSMAPRAQNAGADAGGARSGVDATRRPDAGWIGEKAAVRSPDVAWNRGGGGQSVAAAPMWASSGYGAHANGAV
eukprot:TRINITY_DN51541_c0_g1_i1.p1 TRINITY_DN51541_c0_g1~~TRINITY_DN51541_c0_g1_i1.p1  ORF type:complete len:843 (-),score=216.92 TRINITY_DN51541_c0_g1_i1:91-2619(-)